MEKQDNLHYKLIIGEGADCHNWNKKNKKKIKLA